MPTLVKQVLILAVGTVAALVMVWLGLWQLQVFVESGNRGIAERAEQPPVGFTTVLTPDGIDGDAYGKQMIISGVYLPEQEVLLPADAGVRVLTALQLEDGRVLPVVRGVATSRTQVPPPPAGSVTQTGLLLPGEGDVAGTEPGELGSVRMPLLAQKWPQQLVPGFVTLESADASAHGLTAAQVDLPEGQGSFQNSGYALQWWVFAAVGLGIAIRIAIGVGRADQARRETSTRHEVSREPTSERTPTS
ncbi:MAG: SURF1 family protein [Propioniciclava sp.]